MSLAIPLPFSYKIIRKPRIKHLYLRIKEKEVLVSANRGVSKEYIEVFVRSKSAWIQKQLSRTNTKSSLTDENAVVYLLGKAYPVTLYCHPMQKESMMKIEKGAACFYSAKRVDHALLVSLRDGYYKSCCPTVITPLVEAYAVKMQCLPTKLSYRHNKTRWGSCSAKNALSLNTRLMMLPLPLITYVVIHELAHIRHKNHSSAFWEFVGLYCPDYKELRRNMRVFESFL